MFSLFELVWKRIRLFFTDDEVFYIGGADVLPPPLEREQENRCLIALSGLHGDSEPMTREDARKQLIEHNLRLVVYLARKFENTGICVEDLISIGTIGLIKGIIHLIRKRRSNWRLMRPGVSKMRFLCICAEIIK